MKKELANNENNLNISSDNINIIFGTSDLKIAFMKFKDILSMNLDNQRKDLIFNFNEFQKETKNQSQSLKENLRLNSELIKSRINEEYANENKEELIQFILAQCETIKNNINEQINVFKEGKISLLQKDSNDILKSFDRLSISCEKEFKSIVSIESNEYKINIIEPLTKYKDEMNSFLTNLIKKMNSIITSFQKDYLSMIDSFEHKIIDYIRFGNRKNIQNQKCRA